MILWYLDIEVINSSIVGVPEPGDPGQRLGQDDGKQRREDCLAQRGSREGQTGPAGELYIDLGSLWG